MSSIKDRKSNSSGAYERIIGNKELDVLISKLHATTIAAGRELEKIILEKTNSFIVNNSDKFQQILENKSISSKNIYLISKNIIKKSSLSNKNEPDFIVINFSERVLNIIELKEGHIFDTKKSEGEFKNLKEFSDFISPKISYKTKTFICSFHKNNKKEIFIGLKKKIPVENIMTGEEFCNLLGLNYEEIQEIRRKEINENFDYFVTEFLNIPEVSEKVDQLNKKNKNLKDENFEK